MNNLLNINIVVQIFLLLFVAGCPNTRSNETFVNFTVEGKHYQVSEVGLYYSEIPGSHKYHIMLGREASSRQKTPNVQIQWIMELNSIDSLNQKRIDLAQIASEAKSAAVAAPNVIFTLGKEGDSVSPSITENDNLLINITSIDKTYVEGAFSGLHMDYLSISDRISKKVDISGHFRAKIYNGL